MCGYSKLSLKAHEFLKASENKLVFTLPSATISPRPVTPLALAHSEVERALMPLQERTPRESGGCRDQTERLPRWHRCPHITLEPGPPCHRRATNLAISQTQTSCSAQHSLALEERKAQSAPSLCRSALCRAAARVPSHSLNPSAASDSADIASSGELSSPQVLGPVVSS